jgi:hypothetical protein
MNIQTDTMPKPMHKLVTVAGSGKHVPGDGIGLPARHGGSDLRECTTLSAQYRIVSIDIHWWRLAQTNGASQVGRVAINHGADVDHHRLAFPDWSIARVVMRASAVLPGGDDDRETRTIRTKFVHCGLDPPRQGFLGDAGLDSRCRRDERRVRDACRLRNLGQLLAGFHRTQGVERIAHWNELYLPRCAENARMVRDGEGVVLECRTANA